MKNIYDFKSFNERMILNESDGVEKDNNGEETPFRSSSVLVTLFASELAEHIKYWFLYGELKKSNFVLDDIKDVNSNIEKVEFWASEYVDKDDKNPSNSWRIKYIPVDPEIKQGEDNEKRVSRVNLILDIFDYDTQKRLKNFEVTIPIEDINARHLKDKMSWLKSKILKIPSTNKEIKKFDRRQDRNLRDDAY